MEKYTIMYDESNQSRIVKLTDTSIITCKGFSLCIGETMTAPAECNLGMEVAESEENLESYYEEIQDEGSNEEVAKEIAKESSIRKLSHYAGVVRMKVYSEKLGEIVTDTLLYACPRFRNLSVLKMLETIMEDEERMEYAKTEWYDNKKKGDRLYTIAYEEEICIEKYRECEEFDSDICEVYNIIKVLDEQADTNEQENRIIHPYAVNLAVLFECYARTCIKKCKSNYKMLKYVAKKDDVSSLSEQDYGFKAICKGKDSIYLKGLIIPDIVLKRQTSDNQDEYIILDVKYKDGNRPNREDRLQLLAYAYMYGCNKNGHLVGHIFPKADEKKSLYFSVNLKTSESETLELKSQKLDYNMYFLSTGDRSSKRRV